MPRPLFFAFGLHAHQPVGNFDHVFQEHIEHVYDPFLREALQAGFLPLTLHLSGPLLEWMEAHHPPYLELVGELVADGKLELLLSGYWEPVLPSLFRDDRLAQIQWMQDFLRQRFGVEARGLWLTERVWEPDLAKDLADAGVGYVLVDDRHFVAAGFPRHQLHQPFCTEFGGEALGVFAIDENLRYSIPFQSPDHTVAYLRELRASSRPLAVFADDIEKFGGWPGTREWVYEKGWLRDFFRAMTELKEQGEVRLVTFGQALAELPSGGLAYLPSAAYREMEEWALPAEGFHRLEELRERVGKGHLARGESPLIRGSHWRNYLVKYPESNRMHKKTLALSRICREKGDPPEARRAIGQAQCNDAYWHGVFGGLYLRHLRDIIWRNLAAAEGFLRRGEGLAWERTDLDLDGHEELWIHSEAFSSVVSPRRGGAVEELTLFRDRTNLANTLTRRREAYHESRPRGDQEHEKERADEDGSNAPSIHDLEEELAFAELPPVDLNDRALFQERILAGDLTLEAFRNGIYEPLRSWAERDLHLRKAEGGPAPGSREGGAEAPRWVEISLADPDSATFAKRIRFEADGTVEVFLDWDPGEFPEDAVFTTELSVSGDIRIRTVPDSEVWRFPIATFSKSEKGFDETVQGESVTIRWPIGSGRGRVRLTRP